jgi:hypothetical protein
LRHVAVQRYRSAASEAGLQAWNQFSAAFREFPYGVQLYIIPTQHGPANPLRLRPTGYRPGMVLFPYDGYNSWCGKYPPEAVQRQFSKMAVMWKVGIAVLQGALPRIPAAKRKNAELDLAVAETCHHHFQSTANQIEFYLLRDQGAGSARARARMREIAEDEIELARRQFSTSRDHSVLGYEASNHYYYTPLDLVEKVLNCRQVIAELEKGLG